ESGFPPLTLLARRSQKQITRPWDAATVISTYDIIKLNKREERKQNSSSMKRNFPQNGLRQFRMRRMKWGIQDYAGWLTLGERVGGALLLLLVSLDKHTPDFLCISLKNLQRNYSVLKRKMPIQRQPELQRKQGARFRRPSLLNRRIGNKLYQQKDARQATFLFRRGLKVQTQVHPEGDYRNQGSKRTRPWRTSTRNGGILTISIDNPGATHQQSHTPFLLKKEPSEEKKVPKGVPLQFDINSVGKQTSMTLNERFGILKEQRTALAQNKGSRFVTVA
uniref:UAP56-interacting factor n=1 Tax=Naja naja TaxID=35670 RepID=A0A8C6X9R2_NAJNA